MNHVRTIFLAVFTVILASLTTLTTASIAGTVTVSNPGNAGRVQTGTAEITSKDNERRICVGCHDLHPKATAGTGTSGKEKEEFMRPQTAMGKTAQSSMPGYSACTYKRFKQSKK